MSTQPQVATLLALQSIPNEIAAPYKTQRILPSETDTHIATDSALDSPNLVTPATTDEQSNLNDCLNSIDPKTVQTSNHAKHQSKNFQDFVLS